MADRTMYILTLTDDTRVRAGYSGSVPWVVIDDSTYLYFESENEIHELMGALEQASKFLARSIQQRESDELPGQQALVEL